METSLSILLKQTFQCNIGLCAQRSLKLLQSNNSRMQVFYTCQRHYLQLPKSQNICTSLQSTSKRNCLINLSNDKIANQYRKFSASVSKLWHSSERCKIYNKSQNSSSIAAPATANNDNDRSIGATSKSLSDKSSVVLDRFIYVKTLDSMYEDVHNGIVLDTAYGDSRPGDDFDPSMPVIVALHDTPGTHADVAHLLSFFAKLGCRTICPTFPGHGDTRGIMRNYDDIFSQLTMERATFVHDFLDDLGIKRVDVLIGVGASSYTTMALCTQMAEVYKSMALISPWPLTQPRFDIDSNMLKRIHELWEMVYFRPLVRLLLPAFKIGTASTSEEKVTACYLVDNIDYGEADGNALTAAVRDVPRLVAYGARDDLVSEELYKDLLSKLGISSDQVTSDHQGVMGKDGPHKSKKALVFPDSGYDILTNHRNVLCAYILKLIQQFHPNIKI